MPARTNTGVNNAGKSPGPASSQAPADKPSGASNRGGESENNTPTSVAYDRFSSVVHERNEARNQLAQAQQIIANLSQPRTPADNREAGSADDETLRPFLESATDEEMGREAHQAVVGVSKKIAQEAAEKVAKDNQAYVQQTIAALQANGEVENRIARMHAQGDLDQNTERALRDNMEAEIKANPQWGGVNQLLLLDTVYGRMTREGHVRPGTYQPSSMPGPGGMGGAHQQAKSADEKLQEHRDIISNVRNMLPERFGQYSVEEMEEMYPVEQMGPGRVITTEYGDIEDKVMRDGFSHFRPPPGHEFWQKSAGRRSMY